MGVFTHTHSHSHLGAHLVPKVSYNEVDLSEERETRICCRYSVDRKCKARTIARLTHSLYTKIARIRRYTMPSTIRVNADVVKR